MKKHRVTEDFSDRKLFVDSQHLLVSVPLLPRLYPNDEVLEAG